MANSPCKMDTIWRTVGITANALGLLDQYSFVFINSKFLVVLRHLNQNPQALDLNTEILIN